MRTVGVLVAHTFHHSNDLSRIHIKVTADLWKLMPTKIPPWCPILFGANGKLFPGFFPGVTEATASPSRSFGARSAQRRNQRITPRLCEGVGVSIRHWMLEVRHGGTCIIWYSFNRTRSIGKLRMWTWCVCPMILSWLFQNISSTCILSVMTAAMNAPNRKRTTILVKKPRQCQCRQKPTFLWAAWGDLHI